MSDKLTFITQVTSGGCAPGKDEDTKFRVRSQVMKNLRRKQRLEDKKSQSGPGFNLNLTFTHPTKEFEDSKLTSGMLPSSQRSPPNSSDEAQENEEHVQICSDDQARKEFTVRHDSESCRLPDRYAQPLDRSSSSRQFKPGSSARGCVRSSLEFLRPDRQLAKISGGEQGQPQVDWVTPFFLHGWQVGGSTPSSMRPEEFSKLISIMESCESFHLYTGSHSNRLLSNRY